MSDKPRSWIAHTGIRMQHPKRTGSCGGKQHQWYVIPCPRCKGTTTWNEKVSAKQWVTHACASCNGKGIVKVRASLDELEELL